MYEIQFSKFNFRKNPSLSDNFFTNLPKKFIKRQYFVFWREHCHECAPPICYTTCLNYKKRSDGKCNLIDEGISLQKFGNDFLYKTSFRKWAKLETRSVGFKTHTLFYSIINFIHKIISYFISLLLLFDNLIFKKVSGTYVYFIENINLFLTRHQRVELKYYLFFEVFSYSHDFKLLIETENYKKDFLVQNGWNQFLFEIKSSSLSGVKLYPENDFPARLLIRHLKLLDLKRYNRSIPDTMIPKLIIWDLDNTLWKGTLLEDGEKNLELRKEVIWFIKFCDSLGILNSISSKNDFDNVFPILKKYEIADFFIFSEINWQSKSQGIKKILKNVNVLPSSVIFIDDSSFEREEVKTIHPDILILNENEFLNLLHTRSFIQLESSAESKSRRLSYLSEEIRKKSMGEIASDTDYIKFIESCKLEITLLQGAQINEIHKLQRAKELIMRTNQLNLSGNRYSDEEFQILMKDDKIFKILFEVSDRFGNYGIVGFVTYFIHNSILFITDLVISCRVAKKYIENSLINALIENHNLPKDGQICATYKITGKNTPIIEEFRAMGFIQDSEYLKSEISNIRNASKIVKYHL